MQYVTSVERFSTQKGELKQARKSIIDILRVRFFPLPMPNELAQQIEQIDEMEVLSNLLKVAVVEPLDIFESHLKQIH